MRRILSAITLVAFGLSAVPAWALDPTKQPGQNFDLSSIKLQTPYTGALEIKQPQLATYSSNVFYTGPDGSMTFWCPINGDTTSGTSYPRSELRDLREWALTVNTNETAICKVLTNNSNGETIIGQIHGSISGSEACKLRWSSGKIQAGFKANQGGTEVRTQIGTTTWKLGDTISYSIQMSNHLITVTVNGSSVTQVLNSTWDNGDTYYFKAGTYPQQNGSSSTDASVVAFYSLNNTNVVGAVGAPVFSPAAGNYSSNQTVKISTPTKGTAIRYTTDGSTPTSTNGTVYSTPINISTTTTLQAIAYDSILPASTVTTGSYTIGAVSPVTPAFSGLAASQSIIYGTASVTLSGTLSGTNGGTPVYPAFSETVSASINGHAVSGTVTNATGRFSITYNDASLAADAVSGSPYTTTYAYTGNGTTLNAAGNDTSTSLTVTRKGLTVSGITANNKVYSATTTTMLNTGGAALAGNLDGGNVVLSTAGAAGAFTPDGNVGSNKTVQVSGLTISGSATNNYTLAQPTVIASIFAPPGTVSSYANGVMNINFFGIPGYNYVVQLTTNLSGTWQPISTNTAGSDSSWLFSDPNATNRQQFYRIVTP